jgi:hypothetical protein
LGHERRDEKTKISRRFRSCWLADTGNLNFAANSFMLAIMPVVKERNMENSNSLIQLPKRHCLWNKGKLIGPKPPLRSKHVWSIRTSRPFQIIATVKSLWNPDRRRLSGIGAHSRSNATF